MLNLFRKGSIHTGVVSIAVFTDRIDDSEPASVEALVARIHALTGERQSLRSAGGSRSDLEQNRLAIVQLQWQLSRALIARYGAAGHEPTAA